MFKALIETSDIVIESFQPGYMNQLGLGYKDLIKVKPDIILTSITPFGQRGPKALYKESEDPNLIEAIVAKHRTGPTGVANFYFNTRSLRFENWQSDT